MHRIDTPSRQKDKFGAGKDGFTGGDPQTGTQATQVSADILDALQEEICAVVEGSGLSLDKTNNNQLLTAINILMERTIDAVCPIGQFIYYDGPTVPNDRFIVWKAQAFDVAMYPKLAAKYPSGRLPADLRSEFIRGADEGRGIVNGLLPLMSKPDQTRAHTHQFHNRFGANQIDLTSIDGRIGATALQPVDNDSVHVATVPMAGAASFSITVAQSGGSETNPRYVAALILCRAK